MSFQLGIGDGVALVTVAYGLYANVFVVAKHAPDDFKALLEDLRIVKNVVYQIASSISDLDDSAAKDIIERCIEVLDQFRPLVSKYQKLAFTDHKIWPTRLRYAKDQGTVSKCRKELQGIIMKLQLIPMMRGGQRHPGSHLLPNGFDGETYSPKQQILSSTRGDAHFDEKADRPSSTSYSNVSGSSGGGIRVADSAHGSSPDSSHTKTCESGQAIDMDISDLRIAQSEPIQNQSSDNQPSPQDLQVASSRDTDRWYARAFQEAHHRSHQFVVDANLLEQLDLQRIDLPMEIEEWSEIGLKRVESEHGDNMNLESWLIIGVWWLVKSRTLRYILEISRCKPHSTEIENRDHESVWTSKISRLQAATDLLKAFCILRKVIFPRLQDGHKLTEAHWKSVQDLASGIKHDCEANPDFQHLCSSLDHIFQADWQEFAEPFVQSVEYLKALPGALDSVEPPQRWLAVDLQHCGHKEKVLFRTFVNAQIGQKSVCRKSETAPYMLLLWSRLGRSELVLTLVNQHGTVHLGRAMTLEDLRFYKDHTGAGTQFEYDFPSQDAVIQFLSQEDIDEFLSHPRKLFAGTEGRNPKDCEFLVCRYSLDAYVSRYPSRKDGNAMGMGASAGAAHTACEISLFEMVPYELWKTTRRIVIASTPGIQSTPWNVEFFLPLSMVQVRRAQKDVRLIWSDFTTLAADTDGNYSQRWSYVYTPDQPTFELHIIFENTHEAESFVKSVLQPFQTPFDTPEYIENQQNFETPSLARELRVYQLRDRNVTQKVGYYALCLSKQTPNTNHSSEIYFIHLDLDFTFGKADEAIIEFIGLQVPHYISTMIDMNAEPKPEDHPEPAFASVVRRSKDVKIAFEGIDDVNRLMKTILVSWDLRRVEHIKGLKISSKAKFFPAAQADICVSLWQQETAQGKPLRIAMRTDHNIDLRWTTAALDGTSEYTRKSDRIVLKKVCLQQGHQIDGHLLVATDPSLGEGQPHDTEGTITLVFEHSDQAGEFIKSVNKMLEDWIPQPRKSTRHGSFVNNLFPLPRTPWGRAV